jgi:hypothetical protein
MSTACQWFCLKTTETVCQWFGLNTTEAVFSGLASKTSGDGFSQFGLKTGVWVSWFGPQNRQLRFGDLGLKITVAVSWFGPQNKEGFSLSVAPQNRRREDGMGHVSRSGGLFHLDASHSRVFQSSLMTGGCVTTGGACGIIAEIASRRN